MKISRQNLKNFYVQINTKKRKIDAEKRRIFQHMGLSCREAIDILAAHGHIHKQRDSLVPALDWDMRFIHFCDSEFHANQILNITLFVKERLDQSPEYLKLGEQILRRYRYDKSVKNILIDFDRVLGMHRKELAYAIAENQQALTKWRKAKQDDEVFKLPPELTRLLERSKLLSQIKITRDQIRMIDGKPALLVKGVWTKETQLHERFHYEYSKTFDQIFIIETATNEVFTYLDNGKGLQKFHPVKAPLSKPISTLSEEEYLKTLEVAQKFCRPGEVCCNADLNSRTEIIQIVSSRINGPDTNFHQTWLNARHPWYRYIEWDPDTRQAKVYEIGFGWKKKPWLPLKTTDGRFRSPDSWEYMHADERIVTNMSVTTEELKRFKQFLLFNFNRCSNLGQKIDFRMDHQNCTSLIFSGQQVINIPVPTQMALHEILWQCLPNTLKEVGMITEGAVVTLRDRTKRLLHPVTPSCVVSTTHKLITVIRAVFIAILEALLSFLLNPLRIMLGSSPAEEHIPWKASHRTQVYPQRPEWRWYNLLSLDSYWVHLPSKLQEWQLQQASTVITHNPTRLSIVP
ncbi:MAG TPA: hypothetical protein DCE71_06140 [Parachlamydiales bacterium]|nr:hypothetical protein [Parachlamydiales bacterium]